MTSKNIIVNATALDKGGALTILKQFILAIPENDYEYLIFISDQINVASDKKNIRLIPVSGVKPMHKRVCWDLWGVKKWLKKHQITPVAKISLQNTGFRVNGDVPGYVYYHQAIPFYPFSWSLFKASQRTLWFYKHIYPFFIRYSTHRKTVFFVQTPFVKEGLMNLFHYSADNIHVVSPEVKLPEITGVNRRDTESHLELFYPATAHFYKNHRILFKALEKLVGKRIKLYLTLEEREIEDVPKNIQIAFLGMRTQQEVFELYQKVDAVVFPSYIETVGLPLLEAASCGCPVIVADLPYAHDALKGYEGAFYCSYDNADLWANQIKILKPGMRYSHFQPDLKNSWEFLFKIITKNNIYQNV